MLNTSPEPRGRIRVGISSCLLGAEVRFDGGHKRDPFLVDVLGPFVEWVPVCPEVEIGLTVPRETLRLVERGGVTRLINKNSGIDHTSTMRTWSADRIQYLESLDLSGFVFKRGSPSCGMERVKVYRENNLLHTQGTGIFAGAVMGSLPNLPVEEEGRLNDPRLRENFISAIFAYRRWTAMARDGITINGIMQFHARHKYQLMAHHQIGARKLGNLTRSAADYFNLFCDVMRRTPTRRNHTNALQHLAGYFSKSLSAADRAEMTHVIENYRREMVPLIVPITLIRHYVRQYALGYLENQVYLQPHPNELRLLNQL